MATGRPEGITAEEIIRAQQAFDNQMKGAKSTGDYLQESEYTLPWYCPKCGTGPHACSISICESPGCGGKRPKANFDKDQEGSEGKLRKQAKKRRFGF